MSYRPPRESLTAVSGFVLLAVAGLVSLEWAWLAFQSLDHREPAPVAIAENISAVSFVREEATSQKAEAVAKVVARAAGIGGPPQATESQDAAFAHAAVSRAIQQQPAHGKMIPASLPPSESALAPKPEGGSRTPRIAIIIDDMGLAIRNSIRATELPAPITLSYLPYATNIQGQVDAARNRGHEIMLHMPMEALDRHMYPGPGALTTRIDDNTFRQNLTAMLNSFKGYKGVNNHMGSRMTADVNRMKIVMDAVDQKGVYFVDSWTSPRSVAYQVAAAEGLPRARRDVFLDHYEGQQAVWNALLQAERIARRSGSAVVIGHPKNDTLAVLQAWLPAAQKRGVVIVPASELLFAGSAAKDPILRADAARGHVAQANPNLNKIEPAAR